MRNFFRTLFVIATLGASTLATTPATAQVPGRVPIQGTLYDLEGDPIDGALPVEFTLYSDADGLNSLWSATINVDFVGGIFTAYLGASTPIDPILFAQNPQVFVGIAVDGDSEMELFPVATAPYAAMAAYAGDANTLNGYAVGDIVDDAIAAGGTNFAAASHTHQWNEILGIPSGFADGVDDMLSEAEVDSMVSDNGYLTSVSWSGILGIPSAFADGVDNVLSEAQVDDMVSDNGYLTSVSWSGILGIPSAFADGVDNVLSEAQVDAYANNNGYLTDVEWSEINNVPAGFADGTDNVLSEAQVDAYANNNGYASRGGAVELYNCTLTGYLNSYDGLLNADCPDGKVMRGMYSVHDGHHEDRRFRFDCCSMRITQ